MPNKIQKFKFMINKFKKDITRDRNIYDLAEQINSPNLLDYYFIMTEEMMLSGHSQKYHFDEEGIPIIPSYIDVDDQKMIYYPISIGQYGLAIWQTFLKSKSDNDKNRFLKIAEWFYNNRVDDNKLGSYWLTDVDKPAYRIKAPWKSAFSQARAINILLRAYQVTGRNEFLEISEKALYPFKYPVVEGGVTTLTEFGPFYEEYPSETIPVLVLNGMIFSLCGIFDFVRVQPRHPLAEEIFKAGTETLQEILPKYDIGFWSKYSLCQAPYHPNIDPSTISYHHLHIIQLELMYRLTEKKIFKDYAIRWKSYVNTFNISRMYYLKLKALRKLNRI
jgi:hypothetical protein